MSYQPKIGVNRNVIVPIRFAEIEADRIDIARGSQSRSEYIRGLVSADVNRKGIR